MSAHQLPLSNMPTADTDKVRPRAKAALEGEQLEDSRPKVRPIPASKCHLSQHKRVFFTVFLPDELAPEDIDNPDLWVRCCSDWNVFDRVELIQRERWTEALVYDKAPGYARLRVIQSIPIPERRSGYAVALPNGYSIVPGDPGDSPFKVMRLKDGWEMSKNHRFERFDDARNWLLSLQIFKE